MREIHLVADKNNSVMFLILFEYRPHIVEAVKALPQRKFDPPTKTWTVKADINTVDPLVEFANKFDFVIHADALNYISECKKPIDENIKIPTLKKTLRDFQKIGVAKAIKFERCIIADQMGLGKTIQSIAAVEYLDAYPCLVISPASLKLNWKREIDMWVNKSSYIVSGLVEEVVNEDTKEVVYLKPDYLKPEYRNSDFVIINYDILVRDKTKKQDDIDEDDPNGSYKEEPDEEIEKSIPKYHRDFLKKYGFKSIIIDESQYIRNRKSSRTNAVIYLAKNLKYRFALSGTPMINRPVELITQLRAIDKLDAMGGFWTFAKRYCNAEETNFGWNFMGMSNLKELHSKLIETCFIRRRKTDVLDELPDKQRTYIPIEIDNLSEYNSASSNLIEWMRKSLMEPTLFQYENDSSLSKLKKSQRQSLALNKINRKLLSAKKTQALVKLESLKQLVARGKLNKFKEFIDNFLLGGEKIVIFATHNETYSDLIKKYKDICVSIVGGDSMKKRDDAVQSFQTDPKIRVFIGAIDAAGVGITLTAASTVAFIELGWTSAIHDQCEDRCHRMGQKESVNCYYFYGENTIDDDILKVIENKRKVGDAVHDGEDITLPDKTLEEIMTEFFNKTA
jgi:SWI/SNF-related matrix-associated actin-dependent regulator 1 of chromatin subfamily A